VLRCRIGGRPAWCERRLLARIQRYTLDRLRREIEPVTAGELWRFLACWQHASEGYRLEGPRGVAEVVRKLAGFEIPAAAWESAVLPARVRGYRREWLDELTLTGEIAWGRLWGGGNSAIRTTPICLLPRADVEPWLRLSGSGARPVTAAESADESESLSTYAKTILDVLVARGPSFAQELERGSRLLPSHFEMGLSQLIGFGLITCDSFGGLRRLLLPPSRRSGVIRRQPLTAAGRWSRFRPGVPAGGDANAEFAARQLLTRYGVVFRRLLERERIPVPWRELVSIYRHLELRGELRGGRFVQRFAGEQYALPEAVELMRRLRRASRSAPGEGAGGALGEKAEVRSRIVPVDQAPVGSRGIRVSAGDPLNLEGILTPDARISAQTRRLVMVG
jgi:ATP-dependent Lhr-like helicase